MLVTLAAVVFFASIFIFFSQEFIRGIKRIFEIKGAKTVIPLAIASWLIYTFDYWFLWLVIYYRTIVREVLLFLVKPFSLDSWAPAIFTILVLTLIAVVPVWIIEFIYHKRTRHHYPYPNITSAIIWIVTAVIIVL